MKNLAFLLLYVAMLSACAPRSAQVVTLRGNNVTPTAEGLVLDNDTLTLWYVFSSKRGEMALSLLNKLDRPLYADWKRSSFIVGQNKIDYWYDISDVNLTTRTWENGRYVRYAIGSTTGTITKQDQIAFIPPKTRIEKRQFVVFPEGTLSLYGTPTVRQQRSTTNPRQHKPINVSTYAYDVRQSPLTFRNYLTLSTDKDFKTEFTIDTKFWASDVQVLPLPEIFVYKKSQTPSGVYTEATFRKPDGFYIPVPYQ